jgi:hypothetical protein
LSRATRAGLVALAVAIAVVAFLLVRPAEEDETRAPADRSRPATGETGPAEAEPAPPPRLVVRVRNGAPVGGPRELTVKKDERAVLVVRTTDTTDEVHLHGYDITRELAPGRPARFRLVAKNTGIFEMELHHSKQQIAELRVEP